MNVLSLLSYLCVPLLIPLSIPFFVVPFSSYSYMFRYVHFSLLSSLFTFKSESLSSLPQLVVPIYFLPVLILSFWKTVFMKFLSHFPSKAFFLSTPVHIHVLYGTFIYSRYRYYYHILLSWSISILLTLVIHFFRCRITYICS